jgi:hypothetical protein
MQYVEVSGLLLTPDFDIEESDSHTSDLVTKCVFLQQVAVRVNILLSDDPRSVQSQMQDIRKSSSHTSDFMYNLFCCNKCPADALSVNMLLCDGQVSLQGLHGVMIHLQTRASLRQQTRPHECSLMYMASTC